MKKYKLTALKTKTDTPLSVSVWDFQLSWTGKRWGRDLTGLSCFILGNKGEHHISKKGILHLHDAMYSIPK